MKRLGSALGVLAVVAACFTPAAAQADLGDRRPF
jgi:hypothetical protein